MTKYTIEVTEEQLRVINQALDLLSRTGIGQISSFLETLPLKRGVGCYDLIQRVKSALHGSMIHDIDGWQSHLGICSGDAPLFSKQAWELYSTFRHRLSWDEAVRNGIVESTDSPRKWPEMLTVDYDEPMYFTDTPPPIIKKL